MDSGENRVAVRSCLPWFSMPHIKGSAPVVRRQIVLIRWKTRSTGGIAVRIIQRVVTEQRELCSGADVEVRDQLVLPEFSVRDVLVDGARRWVWKRSGRVRCSRRGGVDVQRQKLVHAARV